jgi:hypothetical protein
VIYSVCLYCAFRDTCPTWVKVFFAGDLVLSLIGLGIRLSEVQTLN